MDIENAGQEIDDGLELSVDDLFKDPEDSQTSNDTSTTDDNSTSEPEINLTENMRHRINEVRRKTETETQNKVAKELGFDSYDELLKANEDSLIREHGFDKDDVEKVLEPLIESRLTNDPRFKKLEEFEKHEQDRYINEQLAEINRMSGIKYNSVDDLPQETINLWSKGVDLDKAYLATEGKSILLKSTNNARKGTLNHLVPPGTNSGAKTRGLTEKEKEFYRSIVEGITDEELSQKTIKID